MHHCSEGVRATYVQLLCSSLSSVRRQFRLLLASPSSLGDEPQTKENGACPSLTSRLLHRDAELRHPCSAHSLLPSLLQSPSKLTQFAEDRAAAFLRQPLCARADLRASRSIPC